MVEMAIQFPAILQQVVQTLQTLPCKIKEKNQNMSFHLKTKYISIE